MKNITIVGASGYTGAELVRLLLDHPNFEIKHLISSSCDEYFSNLYPNLMDKININMEQLNIEKQDADTDAYITALPHGLSMDVIKELYTKTNKPIIDLGADFRYSNTATYEKWYHQEHIAKDIPRIYGLCELTREQIKNHRVIGNPGCYTTCSILAMAPLVSKELIDLSSIIIDAKSGVTGTGKKATANNHFCETNETAKAYSIGIHRHTSEIEEQLSLLCGKNIVLNFTPHLIPINRGIIATCYSNLTEKASQTEIINLYKDYYKDEQFIKVMDNDKSPELKFVVGSNNCYMGITVDNRTNRVIVVSCIDNLIKGASGQAIQNLNILFGLKENTGLDHCGWYL